MDKQIITVIFSFALYVLYVLLPMIPALVIYKLFPDTKISANGKLSGWDLKTTGAFGGYVITVVLGYFLVQNTQQLISQMNNPYWDIKARVLLQNEDGTPYKTQRSNQGILKTLKVVMDPDVVRINADFVHLKIPGHRSDWKNTDLTFEIPGYGYKTINLGDASKDADFDPYDLTSQLSKPIIVTVDKLVVEGYNLDNATPLKPATDGSGPALTH